MILQYEIAHIDLLLGSKNGPVGYAYANALARQSEGHSNLLAVLTPNLAVKPSTVLITKVTIKGMRQAVQMFGPAQSAVAKAVADSVADGVIKKSQVEDLVCVCGVFIHPEADTALGYVEEILHRPSVCLVYRTRVNAAETRNPSAAGSVVC